jgi:transposase
MMARPTGRRDELEIRQCIEEFAHGAKQKDLAKKYGVRQPTISYWVHTFGEKFMGPKFKVRKQGRPKLTEPSDRDKDVISLVANGATYKVVTDKYGLSSARINEICTTWTERGYRPGA